MESEIALLDGGASIDDTGNTMGTPSKKSSSQVFAEEIRRLESEGSKLLEATVALSNSVVTPLNGDYSSSQDRSSGNLAKHSTAADLTALTDITAEQKTIDDLRSYLDAQTRETERLQRSLAEPNPSSSSRFPLTSRCASLSALNLPYTAVATSSMHREPTAAELGYTSTPPHTFSSSLGISNASSGYSTRHSQVSSNQTYLERQIRDMQDEVTGLRSRLKQALSLGEEQKHQFRSAQEDLKRQMTSLINNKDSIIDTKTRELSAHETHISRLQSTIERMEQTNRLQEQAIDEFNHKMDNSQKDKLNLDSVSNQIRRILMDRENRSVKNFSEVEPLSSQPVTKLLHHVERYTIGLETDIEDLSIRLKQATAELDILKSSSLEKHHTISRGHQDKLTELADMHDKELTQAVERSMQARTQLASVQEQLALLRQENNTKLAERDDQLTKLKRELESLNYNHTRLQEDWTHKKEAMETAMDTSQREVSELKREQDNSIYLRAKLESKVDELQLAITKQEAELESHRACEAATNKELEQLHHELKVAREQAEERENLARQLQATIQAAKMESNAQLQTAVASLEREEKERSASQVQTVTERLSETTERLTALNLELEVLKAEHKNLNDRHTELQATHSETSIKLEGAVTAKESLAGTLQERMTDIGRLSQDRDYYIKANEQRTKEVSEQQVEMDKLAVQLEERQKNFTLLKEQNDKINYLLTDTSESARVLREERDKLKDLLQAETSDSGQRKHNHEHLAKKLKIREKHLKDLQEDNQQMATLLAAGKEELEQVVREKDSIFNELKDSRYDVSGLKETNEQLTNKLKESEENAQKNLESLTQKLKETEHDLKITKKAMKTKEHVDGKAVKVAGKMQREVTEKRGQIDALQSKLRWLEECTENIAKERKVLKEETEKLNVHLKRSVVQNERLTNDMAAMSKREVDMRQKLNKYESALEKAAVKHAAGQAQIEQLEQDIARHKLKHQLDIKELSRSLKVQTSVTASTAAPVPSAPVSLEAPTAPAAPVNTFTTSSQAPSTTAPVVQAPAYLPLTSLTSQASSDGVGLSVSVGKELRDLLGEMRSMLQTSGQHTGQQTGQIVTPPSSQIPFTTTATSSCCHHGNHHMDTYEPYDYSPEVYHKRHSSSSGKHRSSVDMKPTKMKKKPSRHYKTPDTIDMYHLEGIPSPSTSPVSDLLIDSPATWQHEVSGLTGITDDLDRNYTVKDFPGNKRIVTDAESICKRLGKKIEQLSELGNHLALENKEIGDLMKNQDMNIKKVRSGGKLLKV